MKIAVITTLCILAPLLGWFIAAKILKIVNDIKDDTEYSSTSQPFYDNVTAEDHKYHRMAFVGVIFFGSLIGAIAGYPFFWKVAGVCLIYFILPILFSALFPGLSKK